LARRPYTPVIPAMSAFDLVKRAPKDCNEGAQRTSLSMRN
jgi:hypothetical protein